MNDDRVLAHFLWAGVDLNVVSMRQLPTWFEIKSLIGTEAVLLGLDTCEDFRKKVPPLRRMIRSAGMFNSGTNLVSWTSLVVAVAKKKTLTSCSECIFPGYYKAQYGMEEMVERLSSFGVRQQSFRGEDAGAIGIQILRALAVIQLAGAPLERVVRGVLEEC